MSEYDRFTKAKKKRKERKEDVVCVPSVVYSRIEWGEIESEWDGNT